MDKQTETLVTWLRDAHAMERATIDNIDRLLDRMRRYPAFCERYRQHLIESRLQLTRIESALRTLDADNSALKDAMMRALGVVQAFGTAVADDEPVKHCLAALSYENFEIASYISLSAACMECGHAEIRDLMEGSLKEEREMARWLETYIPQITVEFLRGAESE